MPDEVTYTYGGAQMTVKLDVFRRNDVKMRHGIYMSMKV